MRVQHAFTTCYFHSSSVPPTCLLIFFPPHNSFLCVFTELKRYPRECADIQRMGLGQKSGVYEIFRPSCLNPIACAMNVSCDLQTDNGGWTVTSSPPTPKSVLKCLIVPLQVIQQRLDETTSFFRDWKSYRDGFGDNKNFWIGQSTDMQSNLRNWATQGPGKLSQLGRWPKQRGSKKISCSHKHSIHFSWQCIHYLIKCFQMLETE